MINHKNLTTQVKREENSRRWFLFDAAGKTLGRFASEVAKVLQGKHRVDFTPHADTGDGVIIINCEKIKLTGSKRARKLYRYYTGHMSGLREVPFETMHARHPTYAVDHAVRGMMPKSRLGKQQLRRLRVYAKDAHDLGAQQPIIVNA